jgi:hypothetical protein
MSRSLDEVVSTLRRAGMKDAADEAQRTLTDPVDNAALDQFCATHGISAQTLIDRMGGSP